MLLRNVHAADVLATASVSFTEFYLYKKGNYTSMSPEQSLHVATSAV